MQIDKRRPKQRIKILSGEAIIFRGDLWHGGCGYEKENLRLYFKLLPKGTTLKEDEHDAVRDGHYYNDGLTHFYLLGNKKAPESCDD